MSFFQRVAAIATISLSLAGLSIPGSAVQAAELAHAALSAPSGVSLTLPVLDTVEAPDAQGAEVPEQAARTDEDSRADVIVAYPTLAAAVAAQDTSVDADEQLRCLAGAIYFESKGEPLVGQLAVARVILNRAEAGRFGGSPCAVVKQRGQFSFVRGGRIPAIDTNRPAYRTAVAVAKVAIADAWDSSAGRALYFHARRVSPRWNHTRVAAIGNHIFYR